MPHVQRQVTQHGKCCTRSVEFPYTLLACPTMPYKWQSYTTAVPSGKIQPQCKTTKCPLDEWNNLQYTSIQGRKVSQQKTNKQFCIMKTNFIKLVSNTQNVTMEINGQSQRNHRFTLFQEGNVSNWLKWKETEQTQQETGIRQCITVSSNSSRVKKLHAVLKNLTIFYLNKGKQILRCLQVKSNFTQRWSEFSIYFTLHFPKMLQHCCYMSSINFNTPEKSPIQWKNLNVQDVKTCYKWSSSYIIATYGSLMLVNSNTGNNLNTKPYPSISTKHSKINQFSAQKIRLPENEFTEKCKTWFHCANNKMHCS